MLALGSPAATEELGAQQRAATDSVLHSAARLDRPTTIWPRSGPPGTRVTVHGGDLPALTPVHVAIGGTRSGFEGLAFLLTGPGGELSAVVEVPDWATRDRTHRLIVFDAYFAPLAVTELFHVTGPGGTIVREGEITEAGRSCAVLTAADGELYALTGQIAQLEVGSQVVVEATFLEAGGCAGGIPVRVVGVRDAG